MTDRLPMDAAPSKGRASRPGSSRGRGFVLASLCLACTLWGWRAASTRASDWREPLVVLALGLIISLLLFVVVRTLADRAQAEEAVRQINEQLEGRVLERTAPLEGTT